MPNRRPLDKQAARDEDLILCAFILVATCALFALLWWVN